MDDDTKLILRGQTAILDMLIVLLTIEARSLPMAHIGHYEGAVRRALDGGRFAFDAIDRRLYDVNKAKHT